MIAKKFKHLLLLVFGYIFSLSQGIAHPLLQNSLWLNCEATRVLLAIDVSEKELEIAHANQIQHNVGNISQEVIQAHARYVLDHIKVSQSGVALHGFFRSVRTPTVFQNPENTFYQFEYEYIPLKPNPDELLLEQTMLKEWEYSAGLPWNVTYVVRFKSAAISLSTFLLTTKPISIITGLHSHTDQYEIIPERHIPVSHLSILKEYFLHGIMHILTGYDHLLFISGLVVVTLSLWEMVSVILAFTLAHTLTLILCVIGLVRLPSNIVEPVIALSIIFIALENIFWPRRTHSFFRLAVAFGFGLIHGLGFAGGLLDAMAGLPPLSTWISLLAFSCGVECGHQLVVLPLFAGFYFLRKKLDTNHLRLVISGLSACIALLGIYYLVIAINEQYLIGK